MKRSIIYFWVLIFLLILPAKSRAYHLNGVKWGSSSYNFSINPIGVDDGLDYSAYSSVVINAAAEWESVSTTNVQVNYIGTTTNEDWQTADFENVVTWKTDGWSGNVIGISSYYYNGSGEIIDSDIKLNTAFAGDSRLAQLVTHEVGHSLGIGHTREQGESRTTDEYEAIMYYLLHSQTDLNKEDKCAITAIYPSSPSCSPTYTAGYHACEACCSDDGSVSVSITNTTHTYDGTPKYVTVSTTPSGLAHTVTYTDASLNVVANPSDAGTYNVTVTITESGYESEGPFYSSMAINQRSLNVSADNKSVDYNDTEPTYTISYSNFASGEDENNLDSQPTADILESWPADPGSYTIYVSGGIDDNYSFAYTNGTLTVNGLSVNSVTALGTSQTYDGTAKFITAETDPPGVAHEISYRQNGSLVPSPVDAGSYDVTITITETGYNPDEYTGTMVISKAELTATADDQSVMSGDPEPIYSITYSGFENGETEAVLDVAPTASVSGSWPLGAGTYPIVVTGGSDNNYNITNVNGTLTVAGLEADSVKFAYTPGTYDGLIHVPVVTTYPNGLDYSSVYKDILDQNIPAPSDAGEYTLEVTITEDGYIQDVFTYLFSIEKAPLAIEVQDSTIVYGAPEPVYEMDYTGFQNGEDQGVLDVLPDAAIVNSWPAPPGTYGILLTGGIDNNYNFNLHNGLLTVVAAEADSVTIQDEVIVYNGLAQYPTINPYPDTIAIQTKYYHDNDWVAAPVDAGNYQVEVVITEEGFKQDTFLFSLLVDKAELQAIVLNDTINYGDPEPEYEIEFTGFVNNEDTADIEILPLAAVNETWPLMPGTYAIELSDGQDNNYNITTTDGWLTVESNGVDLAVTDTVHTYTGLACEATVSTIPPGLAYQLIYRNQNQDTIAPPVHSGIYQVRAKITEPGYEPIEVVREFHILPSNLTVTVDAITIEYGQQIPEFTYTISGFVNNENESVIDVLPVLSAATNNGLPGSYSINADGAIANNYNFTYQQGTLTIVALVAENVEISGNNKTYNGLGQSVQVKTIPENLNYSLVYTDATNQPIAAPIDAGSYSYILTITETGYEPETFSGELSIAPANIQASSAPIVLTYGDDFPEVTVQLEGFVNNENDNIFIQNPNLESVSNWPWDTGNYELSISGGIADNYTFTYLPLEVQILPAVLTVTIENYTIEYNTELPEFSYTITGFKYDDTEEVLQEIPNLMVEGDLPLSPGQYPITASGGAATNYIFEYVEGQLTVEPIGNVTIEVTDIEATYSGAEFTTSANTNPEAIGFEISYETTPLESGTHRVIATVTEPGYLPVVDTGYIVINKASLLVLVPDATVLLGDPLPDFNIFFEGFVNGETYEVLDELPIVDMDLDWDNITAGTYTVEPTGGSDNNYAFSYQAGTVTVIQTYTFEATAGENGWIAYEADGELLEIIQERVAINEDAPFVYAIPDENFHFVRWSNDSSDNPLSIGNLTSDVSVQAIFEENVGVEEFGNQSSIKIYPNLVRANSEFELTIKSDSPEIQKLIISNSLGKKLEERTHFGGKIKVGGLPRGIYQIQITEANKNISYIKLIAF